MNKFLKSLLALLVLLTFSSCVMEVANTNTTKTNGKESFEFNFRSIQELENTKLKVTIFSGDVIVDSKSQIIEKKDENIKFKFNNLLVGDTINVKAEIVDSTNTVIYSGTDSIVIKAGENKVNLTLEPVQVSLTLSPNLDIKSDELNGAIFQVSVNGKEPISVNIDSEKPTVEANIGFVKIGSVLTIDSRIVKVIDGTEILLYSAQKTTGPIKQGGNISLDLTRNNVKLILEATLPTKAGVVSPLGEHPVIVFRIVQSDDSVRSIEYEFNEGEDKATVDFGYFNKGTKIKNIYAFVKESKDSSKELLCSNSIMDHSITAKDKEGSHIVLLELKLPLEVTTNLDPSLTYVSGSTYTLLVNGKQKITQEISKIEPIIHKINVNENDLITVEISKVIGDTKETLFVSKNPIKATLGTTNVTSELQANTRNIVLTTNIPVKDLVTTYASPLIIVNKVSGSPVEKEINLADAITTVTVSTGDFVANIGETLDISIVNIDVVEPSPDQNRVVMYQGSYTVNSSSSSSSVNLNLNQVRTILKVAPPLSFNTKNLEKYRGSLFEVNLNGRITATPIGDLETQSPLNDLTQELGFVTLNEPIPIKARIFDSNNNDEFYTYNGQITPTESSEVINLPNMVRHDGLFVFGQDSGYPFVGLNYNYVDSATTPTITDKARNRVETHSARDFAFTEDGDVWVYDYYGSDYLTFIPHGSNKNLIKEYSLDPTSIEGITLSSPRVNSLIAYKDGILMAIEDERVTNLYYIYPKETNPSILVGKKLVTTLPTFAEYEDYEIGELVLDGNTIYAGFSWREGQFKSSFRIYKGTLSNDTVVFESTPLFDSNTYTDEILKKNPFIKEIQTEAGPEIKGFAFDIKDLTVIDNNLYVLLLDQTRDSNYGYYSRGGLLKIDQNGKANLIGLHENELNNGVMMLNTEEDTKTNFLGPRKFIAIKPKKLVIADVGAVASSKTDSKDPTVHRDIKVINLDTLTIESNPINETLFGGSISSNYYSLNF